jgi:branched-chain amino acid transport system substrate-binding protein
MRKLPGIVAVAAGALVLAGCTGISSSSKTTAATNDPYPKGETLKIAVIEPFSGPFGFYGPAVANSIKLQVKKINAAGGLMGHKLEVVTRDNQLSPQPTVVAAREMAADPSVIMVEGPSFDQLFDGVKSSYESAKKLNCQVALDGDTTIQGLKYTFRDAPYNAVSVRATLAYLQKNTSIKTLGLVFSHDAVGQQFDADIAKYAPQYGIKYLGVQYFNSGAPNQLAQVQALKSADAIWVSAVSNDAAVTALAAEQLGYKGQLVGQNGLQAYTYIEIAGAAGSGTIFSSNSLLFNTTVPKSQWPAAYRSVVDGIVQDYGVLKGPKSGVEELNGTTLSANCVDWLQAAVQKAGGLDSTKVAQAWEHLSLPASQVASANSVKFTPDNHDAYSDPSQLDIYQWVQDNGKWTLKLLQSANPS